MNGEKDIDLDSLYELKRANKIKLYDGMLARHIAEILLNLDNGYIPEAEEWIKKAIATDTQNGMVWWHLARDYALYGELFKRKDDALKAGEHLTKAVEIFADCGADGWMKKYRKQLALIMN